MGKDREYWLRGQGFIWDEDKYRTNILDHGVRFEEACEVFFDPFYVLEEVTDDDGERRDAALGLTFNMITLVVVYTEREGNMIRIISAWQAKGAERKRYENNQ